MSVKRRTGQAALKGEVREKPMISQRNAEAAGEEHDEEKHDLKPIEAKMVKVERHRGQR